MKNHQGITESNINLAIQFHSVDLATLKLTWNKDSQDSLRATPTTGNCVGVVVRREYSEFEA